MTSDLTADAAVNVLDVGELELIDAYWRAANYLSVGQIYLLDNPLLRGSLVPAHVKPRLIGHWGTTPGLNLLYARDPVADADLLAELSAHVARVAPRSQRLLPPGPGLGSTWSCSTTSIPSTS
jgi:hypothetical protein